jgi:hypothetical protein
MTPDSPNDPSELDPPAPTAVDPVDERLSAALDGPADPEAAPGAPAEAGGGERAAALAAARDLLAIPPPPLDDLTRRRLVRVALDELPAGRRRERRWATMVAVAAAVLGFIVVSGALIAALNHQSRSNSKAAQSGGLASRGATGTTNGGAPKPAADLREVSDPAVLRRKVEAALRSKTPPFATENGPTSRAAADSVAGAHCLSTVRLPAGATSGLLGNATFHGAPAVIVVGRDGPRVLIYVLANNDCRLLTSQFLRE